MKKLIRILLLIILIENILLFTIIGVKLKDLYKSVNEIKREIYEIE